MLTQHEAGFVDGDAETLHAGRRTLNGRMAVYGAGRLIGMTTDRFDPDGPHACPACKETVASKRR